MRHLLFAVFSIILLSPVALVAQVMWEPARDIAAAHFDNNHPRITTDRAGNPLIIWGKGSDIEFSKWNGTNFSTPVKLNAVSVATQDWMGPDIASHGDTMYVVFKQTPEDNINSHIWLLRSFDGGLNFAAPVRVDYTGDSLTRFPTVVADAEGQPIVAFMKFNSTFGDARWAVTRSNDFGATFSPDVKASGWSGPASDVCDCCPGNIVSEGDRVSVLYRDNNANIRDNWAALSDDGGRSFYGGINLDQQNWYLENCPASGPDGVIVGDTIYSISMNGASNVELVYFNKASLPDMNAQPANTVTNNNSGLIQNYPRMASFGTAVAMAWRQSAGFNSQLGIKFTSDIAEGFPEGYDTIAFNNVVNVDLALSKDMVYVVWQDGSTNTVRYKAGEYQTRVGVSGDYEEIADVSILPNPSKVAWKISWPEFSGSTVITLTDMNGNVISMQETTDNTLTILNSKLAAGSYVLHLSQGQREFSRILVKL